MSGWLKLHRSTLAWEWYGDSNTTRVWLHLLLTANYEPNRYMGHEVPAGASVHGREEMAQKLGISVKSVRTALERLKNGQQVAITPCAKFSIISILNWSQYQEEGEKTASTRPASGQQTATLKEGKNSFSKEKDKHATLLPHNDLPKSWGEWTLTDRGWNRDQVLDAWTLFREYWTLGKGAKTKRSPEGWLASWRQWCRKDAPAKNNTAAAGKAYQQPEKRYTDARGSNRKVITSTGVSI